jgi:hypothetical protein
MNTSESIMQFTQAVARNALPFLIAVGAIGTLSMAIIQSIKETLPARAWFHRWFLQRWLTQKAAAFATPSQTAAQLAASAHADLVRLATAGDDEAFHDLPIEQLCGQAQAAVQVVLDYPGLHPDLLKCLAAQADPEDINALLAPTDKTGQRPPSAVDARGRVLHQIQRSLDGLQIAAGYSWSTRLQVVSFTLSFVFTVIGLWLYSRGVHSNDVIISVTSFFKIVFVGLASGFLAPVARDLVAALEKLRK